MNPGKWLSRSTVSRIALFIAAVAGLATLAQAEDWLKERQHEAVKEGKWEAAHWGIEPDDYIMWSTHSNRLIPVYTYGTKGGKPGVDLESYLGKNSLYRNESAIRRVYGFVPAETVNPEAEYGDQTNIYDLQKAAVAAGKKHIFLVVFDGMDWQMSRAAAIYKTRKVAYDSGRGTGLHFQDYSANGTTQFGCVVTAPHNEGTTEDVDRQSILNPGGKQPGGYSVRRGGPNPWTPGDDPAYLLGQTWTRNEKGESRLAPGIHCYPDSSATATSMTAGIKTYNGAINVDANGAQVSTIAHQLQAEGWLVGAVSSVPIPHATPASAYAHNVSRDDYQDLSRDMIGLKSIAHPNEPLPGMDVVIGGGKGTYRERETSQGKNFVPGERYLTEDDLNAVDVRNGGKYTVAVRADDVNGSKAILEKAREAAEKGTRLLGFYGVGKYEGHLPYETADGEFDPTIGRRGASRLASIVPKNLLTAERYSESERLENPSLADMTEAALTVLGRSRKNFWLMVESGDVDWAMHDNNLDNAIGAVYSGDRAIRVITDWVEKNSNWDESLLIVTADHGHMLVLERPELLIPPDDRETKK